MKTHELALQLATEYSSKDLSEADTRHRLIDPLLHDVLGWPRNRVRCEDYIQPGFADYVLVRSNGSHLLFIEAKRQGSYFNLPNGLATLSESAHVKVSTLLTDENINRAITQVRTYCLNTGCEFAAITNGHQWIFFKTFEIGQDWRNLRALVIYGVEYFSRRFLEAHNTFSYHAIVEKASLRRLFAGGAFTNRELFYPKDRIVAYDAPVDANGYASSLRPIADKYFGVIDATDSSFMESCYVSDRDYDLAFINAKRHLEDAVTPFLAQFNIRDFRDSAKGGGFGKRIARNIVGLRPADVVVLFGGKGVGKSTFLRRLLIHRPPPVIAKNGVIVLIDLLNVPPSKEQVQNTIWTELERQLDHDGVLHTDRAGLCLLFEDRFTEAKNQYLYGLNEQSESYNVRLNDLVSLWKGDHPYVTKCLAARLRAKHKAIIVTIDNTDQFDDDIQELCFATGRSIAATFPCVVVISMREERFYASSIRGVLDAYQNSGFHISSPVPKDVFIRRIDYVRGAIQDAKAEGTDLVPHIDSDVVDLFLKIMRENFGEKSAHLSNFLTACSHGNIRFALELFRGFLVSGYTNVREMTNEGQWVLQTHQVIKPFMIPSRFFYNESLSRVPNIYQIRSKSHGSHFTALRILDLLVRGHDKQNPPFVPVATLSMIFVETYAMNEDFQLNMDVMLKHNLIEANNRLDKFGDAVDSVKITTYGIFMLSGLSHDFTYLELVAEDCAIGDIGISNQIAEQSNDEYRFFSSGQALERMQVRLERTEIFLKYLASEEARETHIFKAPMNWSFTNAVRTSFDFQKVGVMRSAQKNAPRKASRLDK